MNLKILLYFHKFFEKLFEFKKYRKKGFVLVSVLMLGVLLISCATAFTWFVRMQVRSVGRERIGLEYRSMAQVFANAVVNILSEISGRMDSDNPTQRWYQPFIIPVEDLGIWVVKITPLDDKIPLGNLFLPDGNTLRREISEPWENMWEKLGMTEFSDRILDFLDRNTRPRVGGIERDSYINRSPFDISEMLIMSEDITPEILYGEGNHMGIADYCTIYSDGKINVNYAPEHVLELLPGLDTGLAGRIVQIREEKALESLRDIQEIPGASPRTSIQLTNIIAFKSRYFNLSIQNYNASGSQGGVSFNIIFDRTSKRIVRWEES